MLPDMTAQNTVVPCVKFSYTKKWISINEFLGKSSNSRAQLWKRKRTYWKIFLSVGCFVVAWSRRARRKWAVKNGVKIYKKNQKPIGRRGKRKTTLNTACWDSGNMYRRVRCKQLAQAALLQKIVKWEKKHLFVCCAFYRRVLPMSWNHLLLMVAVLFRTVLCSNKPYG